MVFLWWQQLQSFSFLFHWFDYSLLSNVVAGPARPSFISFFFLLIVAYDHINEHRVRVATKKSYSLRYSQLFKKVIPSRPIRTFVRTDRSVICRQLAFHSSNLIYSYLAMIRFYDCVITCSIHFECQLRWLQLGSILSSPVFSNPTRQVRLFVRG